MDTETESRWRVVLVARPADVTACPTPSRPRPARLLPAHGLPRDYPLQERRASLGAGGAAQALAEASAAIEDLSLQTAVVGVRAVESERAVDAVVRGIRQLDAAKRNLGNAVDTLRRLAGLLEGADALERAAEERAYVEAARRIEEVRGGLETFARFQNVPKVGGQVVEHARCLLDVARGSSWFGRSGTWAVERRDVWMTPAHHDMCFYVYHVADCGGEGAFPGHHDATAENAARRLQETRGWQGRHTRRCP